MNSSNTSSSSLSGQSNQMMTAEGVFLGLYVDALRSLQRTWLDCGDSGFDREAFNVQIAFLTNLIPDVTTREKINTEQSRLRKEILEDKDGRWRGQRDYVEQHSGMAVVPYMIEFICSSFDLLHFDITGPATSKQYRDAALEIPDMPVSKMEPELVEPVAVKTIEPVVVEPAPVEAH